MQEEDVYKATLIELDYDLIEQACFVIRSAVANSMDWSDIELLVKDAQTRGDPVAQSIHGLKLLSNHNYYNDAQVCQCIAMLYWIYMCMSLIESQILVMKMKERRKLLVESVRRKLLVYVFL